MSLLTKENVLRRLARKAYFAYVAHPDFTKELHKELGEYYYITPGVLISPNDCDAVFALDKWQGLEVLEVESIGDAAKKLKAINTFWHAYAHRSARRTALIEKQLPALKKINPLTFPVPGLPDVGVFTLLDDNTILYSLNRDQRVPKVMFPFVEDKVNPPNRAYLKLWEALSILGRYPNKKDLALDFGATPGGWTYVLQSLGASVIAIDKAPLDKKMMNLPGVEFQSTSAFSLKPEDFPDATWLVGDMACYPERLYDWLLPWLNKPNLEQCIMTIKLQGETDFEMLKKFQAIPNSRVRHMAHNKHEATFFYPA